MRSSDRLGTESIGKLLREQAVPASVGFLVMSIYMLVDMYFVSHYVGKLGIAAINIVMPITFLISSFGMAVGIGGASVISRALGANNKPKAYTTFGNQTLLTVSLALILIIIGALYLKPVLALFGSNKEILPFAESYFEVVLPGIPFLAWAMMSNNVIRAQGKPRVAMFTLLIPALANIILDPLFMIGFDMGIAGAGWATSLGYTFSAVHTLYFFTSDKNELRLKLKNFFPSAKIVSEIFAIGSITLARQGSFSLLAIVLNHYLNKFGGTLAISEYGLIRSVTMFILFPVIGIMQGFMPIAGYNYGAVNKERVRTAIRLSITWGSIVSTILFVIVLLLSDQMIAFFTDDPDLLRDTPFALKLVFIGTPVIGVSMISAAYFQAIGKAFPALILTLSRQLIFVLPFVILLPHIIGLNGIWIAFPAGEICAAVLCGLWLKREMKRYFK